MVTFVFYDMWQEQGVGWIKVDYLRDWANQRGNRLVVFQSQEWGWGEIAKGEMMIMF